MPPLTEVSEFDIRRNKPCRKHSQPSTRLRPSPLKLKMNQEENETYGLPPPGIETGDISHFPARSLESSMSNSQASCRRSGSFESVVARQPPWGQQYPMHLANGNGYYGSAPRPSRKVSNQESGKSVKKSYHIGQRPRMRGQRSYVSEYEGSTNPSAIPYGFQSHRSLRTLRSHNNSASYQSQAHFPYLTQSRASSSRIDSPAFSDLHAGVHPSMSSYGHSASVRPNTPTYLTQQRHPFHNTDMNRSVSSLQRFPSPAMSNGCYSMRRSPFPSRSTTPVPLAFSSSSVISNQSWESFHRPHRSLNTLMPPTYYDYSEPYMQEPPPSVRTNPSTISLPVYVDHEIQEDESTSHIRQAQTPFGLLPGSIFSPCELPALPDSLSYSALDLPRQPDSDENVGALAAESSRVKNTTTVKVRVGPSLV